METAPGVGQRESSSGQYFPLLQEMMEQTPPFAAKQVDDDSSFFYYMVPNNCPTLLNSQEDTSINIDTFVMLQIN